MTLSLDRALAALAAATFACSLIVAISSCEWHTSETLLVFATGGLLAAAVRAALRQSGWTADGRGGFSVLLVAALAGLVSIVLNLAAIVAVWALFTDCGGGV
jgi:hypothetical protein